MMVLELELNTLWLQDSAADDVQDCQLHMHDLSRLAQVQHAHV